MSKDDHYAYRSPVTGEVFRPHEDLRFQGLPTFLRTPLAQTLEDLDIALVGVPFDGGLTARPGARHGPREIRNQSSMMRSVHHVSRIDPYSICRIADVGDVRVESLFSLDDAIGEIETFYRALHAGGVVPLSIGGDHSITYPILKALADERPVGLVHIDAHTDTWDAFQGSKFHHGAPFRRAVEDGLVDPKRAIQIGIRGAQNFTEGWDFSAAHGMRVVFIEEFARLGVDAVIDEARRVVGDGPVYVSFDVDALDPAYAPGTGTPEVGGLTTLEAQSLIRGLRGLDLVGGDVVEVSPPFDPSGNTALVGATLMYEILCPLAEAVAKDRV